ncbi:MAG: bifunctional DNA primase/polymerase [Deltaproteobacteria bacterium]|nr:bifunctional DNA primase/polymerase [Deltaproteobacteria bacterium]
MTINTSGAGVIPKWYPEETKKRKQQEKKQEEKVEEDPKKEHIKECEKWARAYYNQGLNVIPIKYKSKAPNGFKKNEIKEWHHKRIPEEIFEQWIDAHRFENIAILGGHISKDMVCFDIDNPEDFKILELSTDKLIEDGAWVTETPKEPGRFHIVIRDKDELKTNRLEKHIDYRANEHYWLVFPSIHPNGKPYNFLNTHNSIELKLPATRNTLALFEKWNDVLSQKKGTTKTIKATVESKEDFDNSPDCIRNAMKNGASPGMRYYVAQALSSYLQQQKFPLELAIKIVMDWFETKCSTEGRPKKDIKKAIKLPFQKKKYATGCKFWREKTVFCPYENKKDCKFCTGETTDAIVIDEEMEELHETTAKKFVETPGYIDDNSFIGQYTKYQNMLTNAPKVFATHLCISMLGNVMGKKTRNKVQPFGAYHNIYSLLLGKSGKAKKSTAQGIARNVYLHQLAMPDGFSPEGYLGSLSEHSHGMGWMGEFSTLLRGINQGGYMANFKELMNDLLECPFIYEKRLSQKKNSFTIVDPYLSIVSTCTEEGLIPNLNPDMIHGGFLARFMMIFGETEYRKRSSVPDEAEELESNFRTAFMELKKFFEKETIVFELTKDGYDALDEISKDLETNPHWNGVSPFIARYQHYLPVYADIIRFSDMLKNVSLTSLTSLTLLTSLTSLTYENTQNNVVNRVNVVNDVNDVNDDQFLVININSDYIKRAWEIILPCLEYTRKLVKYIEEDYKIAKVETTINNLAPVKHSAALQYSHLTAKDFNEMIGTLKARETIFSLKTTNKTSNRKWIKYVYCTRENIDTNKCKKCIYKCSQDDRDPPLPPLSKNTVNNKKINIKATPKTDENGFYFDTGETKDKQKSLDQARNLERIKEYVGNGLVTEAGLLAFIKNILNKREPEKHLDFLIERGIVFRSGGKLGFSGG